MARQVFDDWIPEEQSGVVLSRVAQLSAIETTARIETMVRTIKSVPRSGNVTGAVVAKGGTYGESGETNDEVLLTARKYATAIRIAEEDLADTQGVIGIIENKQRDWATGYAKWIDNACLAVTGTEGATGTVNGQTAITVPFTSAYKALTSNDAGVGYTANTNLIQTAGALTYADLVDVLNLVEDSDYYDEFEMQIIASPAFRKLVRGLVNSNGDPIFTENSQWPAGGVGPTLMGLPVKWTTGAKTSATATSAPTGNPLLFVFNRQYAILGKRSGPESMIVPSDISLSDEDVLKMRARRAFKVGNPFAFAVLEKTS